MFTKFIRSVLVGCLLSICQFSAPLLAGVPQLISYQGRVVVDGVNFDSGIAGHPGIFRFALVSGDGSATYWSNDGSSVAGSEPIAGVSLPVSKGLYSVPLGEVQAPLGMTPIALSVFANPDVRLRVWFDDGIHGSQLLSPDQRVAAVGYAMMAAGVADGAVQAASIAPGAVDNTKLSNASITISAGAGLAGGGVVPLGGTITLGNAGVLSLAGGGGITVSNATGTITLGSNATDVATPNSLVMRDASGNFKAGNITADLFGNASSATTALTAGTALTAATAVNATNFSGPLLGDVTGNQGSTLVAQVGGKSAAMIATGTDAANGATDLNMAGALVKRNANGDFSARQITAANFAGDGAALTGVPGTFIWQTASGTAQAAVANTGYLADNPAQVTLTLPANATVGDIVRVNGVGAGGWKVIPAVTQGIVGFDAGQGPAGSQGTGTAVQFIGNGQWQPTGESVLPAGVVQSQQIANGAVTSAKMAGGSIGSAQLTTGAVQSANIAAGAVDNTKLANPSLTLNTGTGLAGGGDIALGGARTLSIADSGVGSAQLAPGAALANLSLGGLSLGTAGVPTFAGAKLLNIGTGDNKPELLFDRGITPKGRVTYQRTAQDAGWSGLVFSINADWNDATGYVYDDGGKSQSILQMEYEYTDVHGNQLNELNWTVSGYRTLHFTTDVHDTSRSICNLSGCTTIDFPVANPTVLNDEAGRIFRATAARDNGDVQAWIGNYSDSSRGAGLHLASRSTTDQWSDNPADWVSLWSIHSDPRGNGSNEFGIIDHHLGAYRFLINQAGCHDSASEASTLSCSLKRTRPS